VHIPDHYLRSPAIGQAPDVGGFERLFAEQVSPGTGAAIRYQLAAPKWQFLCWMTETKKVVLHGANGSTVDTSLVNACIHLVDNGADTSYYYFSVNHDAMTSKPWVAGTIYVLARDTFEAEPEDTWQGLRCAPTQWVSPVPVRPMARLTVTPDDFPFLRQVRSHDQRVVSERAAQSPDNFPWLDEP
jgi:hypothetical protein